MRLEKSEAQYSVFLQKSEHGNLVDLWLATHYGPDGSDVEASITFSDRQEAFLWALERLLQEGRIKPHKNGVFLEMSIDELIDAIRQAWPLSEKPYPTHPDADFYLWFIDPACPAGIAWRQVDGSYLIAD